MQHAMINFLFMILLSDYSLMSFSKYENIHSEILSGRMPVSITAG